jgi:hypothetical protein
MRVAFAAGEDGADAGRRDILVDADAQTARPSGSDAFDIGRRARVAAPVRACSE